MNTLTSRPTATVLERLFREAATADAPLRKSIDRHEADRERRLARDAENYRDLYRELAENYLNVTAGFGRFLYLMVRATNARTVVEFGTSMGISTLHLAAALRDNGGGHLITTELEEPKAERARANLHEAGLADLVDVRIGDALETLREDVTGVDFVFLDGAISLYLPVLRTLEPALNEHALIIADNTNEAGGEYLPYVRDPENGYITCRMGGTYGKEITLDNRRNRPIPSA